MEGAYYVGYSWNTIGDDPHFCFRGSPLMEEKKEEGINRVFISTFIRNRAKYCEKLRYKNSKSP